MDEQILETIRKIRKGDVRLRSHLDNLYRRLGSKNCPCPVCVCVEAIPDDSIFCYDCEWEHWPHEEYLDDDCDCEHCNVPTYDDTDGVFLELHAHRTYNYSELTPDQFHRIVNMATEYFLERTGQTVYLLGRSGRHVCVEDTLENRANYEQLREHALVLEQWVLAGDAESDPPFPEI
jgi:hypothetical protein